MQQMAQKIIAISLKSTYINLFPDDKNLTLSKLKAFAEDKTNVT